MPPRLAAVTRFSGNNGRMFLPDGRNCFFVLKNRNGLETKMHSSEIKAKHHSCITLAQLMCDCRRGGDLRRIFLNSVINIAALMIAGSTIIQSASIMAVEVANTILPSCDCLAPIDAP
jgi:hypothetical protein